MRYYLWLSIALLFVFACTEQAKEEKLTLPDIQALRNAYADVELDVDMSHLDSRQQELVRLLVEAAKIADSIFWYQSAHDALATRATIAADPEAGNALRQYVEINYGAYDRIHQQRRFYGEGPAIKPAGAGFYPEDLTRAAFTAFIEKNPRLETSLTDPYSVVVYDPEGNLRGIPYHEFYADEVEALAAKLDEAVKFTDNRSLAEYLEERAKALRSDDYFVSDVKWLRLEKNDIDVVIGPIEKYEDRLFGYKTAFEAAVMVKDPDGSARLARYQEHLLALEKQLPLAAEYIRSSVGSINVLEVVNIVFFAGDFMAGVKTIAASLPNDPMIQADMGSKKQMYKNLIEAKFSAILVPLSYHLLAAEDQVLVDREAFTDFITLHEVSHTLGPRYVEQSGTDVGDFLKEHYSAIEEAKADILAVYAIPYLVEAGIYSDSSVRQRQLTYLVGIFRSIRFGISGAHGQANMCQFNYLREAGAIVRREDRWTVDSDKFHAAVTGFSRTVLTIQAQGDYEKAGAFLAKYSEMPPELVEDFKRTEAIPRDIHLTFAIDKTVKPL
jgi:hypothetical protein